MAQGRALLLKVLVLVLSVPGALAAQQLLDRVVARVGTTPIMLTDVTAARGLGLVDNAVEGSREAEAIEQLIDRQLVLAEVERFSQPAPVDDAVEDEAARLRARAGDGLNRLMLETGLDDQSIRDMARDNLRIRDHLNQRFGETVQVSDDEVLLYYFQHEAEFSRDGELLSFDEVEPVARQRAAALRRATLIQRWQRDLRGRGAVTIPPPRP